MKTLDLGEIQFYWRVAEQHQTPKNVVPDFLPFEFIFEESTQLIRQKKNKVVLDSLEKIYLEEFNVGYLQEGHAMAEGYGNDISNYVEKAIVEYIPNAKRLLEVGCGGGYMLNKFRKMGLTVMGVDPSPIAVDKGVEFNYEVIKDFYPSKQTFEKVDIIFHYDVLEHIENHIDFIRAHKKDLNDNGVIMFAVPDDTHCLNIGDVSMVIHEHINYFDKESLKNTVEKGGFKVLEIQQSNYGGVLYCVAQKLESDDDYVDKKGDEKFTTFILKAESFNVSIKSYIDAVLSDPKNSLGVYIALRLCPYLTKYKDNKNIRFFDDDPNLRGKFYDGYNVPVESMNDIAEKTLTHLFIASHSFGDKILTRLKEKVNYPIEIKQFKDFI
jgi:2-polyprenyl-3-methyl-5-hydroxy-6-metoxy-1,4-benzoquinol methylase